MTAPPGPPSLCGLRQGTGKGIEFHAVPGLESRAAPRGIELPKESFQFDIRGLSSVYWDGTPTDARNFTENWTCG